MTKRKIIDQESNSEYSPNLESAIQISELFLQTNIDTINYDDINNKILKLSGAKYSAFNIYNSEGTEYTTVSITGISEHISKAVKLLGFELNGKTWPHDKIRAEKIRKRNINYFDSLASLTGDSLSPLVISSLQKTFSLGSVIVAKIEFKNIMLGDFTLIFSNNSKLKNEQIFELYLKQCGLFLSRLKYEKELLELNTRKDTILSIVSHDLRGPIGNFRNLIDFMLSNENNFKENEITNVMRELSKATSSIYDLIENLLNWARLNKNSDSLKIEEVNIKSVFEITRKNLLLALESKNINLKNNIKDTAIIMADKDSIEIVARNLISNAIKFSKQSGIIEVSGKTTSKQIKIYIKDNGTGISKDVLAKINANSRVSNFGTNHEKGSGLGLSFCKEMIKLNNGEIVISGKLGRGTTIELIFNILETYKK